MHHGLRSSSPESSQGSPGSLRELAHTLQPLPKAGQPRIPVPFAVDCAEVAKGIAAQVPAMRGIASGDEIRVMGPDQEEAVQIADDIGRVGVEIRIDTNGAGCFDLPAAEFQDAGFFSVGAVEGGMCTAWFPFPTLLREGDALYPIPRMMVNSPAMIAMKAPSCNHRARYRSDLTAKISALVAS